MQVVSRELSIAKQAMRCKDRRDGLSKAQHWKQIARATHCRLVLSVVSEVLEEQKTASTRMGINCCSLFRCGSPQRGFGACNLHSESAKTVGVGRRLIGARENPSHVTEKLFERVRAVTLHTHRKHFHRSHICRQEKVDLLHTLTLHTSEDCLGRQYILLSRYV